MRWAGRVAFMEEETYAHRTLHINSAGKNGRGEIKNKIKISLKEIGKKVVACVLQDQDRNQ
jgi:hypothetical protein